jgi:hypothetical protein
MIVGMTDNLTPITDEDDYSDDDFLAVEAEEVFVVEEAPVEEIALDAEEEIVVPVAIEEKPAKAKAKKSSFSAQTPPPTTPHVISKEETDNVFLSQCVYKSKVSRKSLTVHHLQRRLKEWGFKDAFADKDGYYADKTKKSVAEFQESAGLAVTGLVDAETFTRIFEGDTNVTVVLS